MHKYSEFPPLSVEHGGGETYGEVKRRYCAEGVTRGLKVQVPAVCDTSSVGEAHCVLETKEAVGKGMWEEAGRGFERGRSALCI